MASTETATDSRNVEIHTIETVPGTVQKTDIVDVRNSIHIHTIVIHTYRRCALLYMCTYITHTTFLRLHFHLTYLHLVLMSPIPLEKEKGHNGSDYNKATLCTVNLISAHGCLL